MSVTKAQDEAFRGYVGLDSPSVVKRIKAYFSGTGNFVFEEIERGIKSNVDNILVIIQPDGTIRRMVPR